MRTSLSALFFAAALPFTANARGTVYSESKLPFSNGGKFKIDLDRDSVDDIEIDLRATHLGELIKPDPYFLAKPLGNTAIAQSNGITTSFSAPVIVPLKSLSWAYAPKSLMTGGLYLDSLGNVAAVGWGGGSYDDFGNLVFQGDGPDHQIDLFLVKLSKGVAWVSLQPAFIPMTGEMVVQWNYLPTPPRKPLILITPLESKASSPWEGLFAWRKAS